MLETPAVRSICHAARNPRSQYTQPSLIPVLIERLHSWCVPKLDLHLELVVTDARFVVERMTSLRRSSLVLWVWLSTI